MGTKVPVTGETHTSAAAQSKDFPVVGTGQGLSDGPRVVKLLPVLRYDYVLTGRRTN